MQKALIWRRENLISFKAFYVIFSFFFKKKKKEPELYLKLGGYIGVEGFREEWYYIYIREESPWKKVQYISLLSLVLLLLLLIFNANSIFIFPYIWNKQIKQDKK